MSQPSTPNLPIPSRVGNYQLLKTIGKGQFGYVKLAIHDLTRERVAIKIIQKNRLDEKTLRMVSREISIMKLLNHPNVIRLYEVIDSEIFLFLVMEYAAGGEIMDFIVTHGKLKERDARRIFRQVVEAIDYCHEVHVIHRDLKAENLLLDSQLGIKLIDFGLSNRWAPGELLKTFCGSPTYTAPELIKRQQYEGPEVDLWSMGVLLYVLVCGSLPFDGNTFQELFTKIINGQYLVPDHVSLECRDLIGRMLVVNPKQRATLDQVREHPWIRESGKPVPKASLGKVSVPINEQDMDQDVLDELMNIGFEREYAIQAVLSNSYDDAAATYYLLVEAKRRRTPTPHQQQYQQQQQQLQQPGHVVMSTPTSPNPASHHQHGSQHQFIPQQHQAANAQQYGSGRPAFDAPPPPRNQQIAIPQVPVQHAPPPPQYQSGHGQQQQPLKRSGPQQQQAPTIVLPSGYSGGVQESQNPAYRGQPSRRAQRENSKGHRRHHTVGTPGEFPIEEDTEDALLMQQSQQQSPGQSQQQMQQQQMQQQMQQQQQQQLLLLQRQQQQYLASKQSGHQRQKSGLASPTPSPDSVSPSISPSPMAQQASAAHAQSKTSATNSDHAVRSNSSSSSGSASKSRAGNSASSLKKSGNTDEDSELMALESDQLANLNISGGNIASAHGSSTTSSNSGKPHRGRHMRMLSNPPPIEEEDEMFYPPQAAANALSSDATFRPARPARPTGGLPPKSATMRSEKTRHKDHSRPVAASATSKKKHSNRTSLDPEDPSGSTAVYPASSSSKDKRNSDKKYSGGSSIPTSPRIRKSSKGSAGSAALSSSPPLSDEDSHMVLLNPSTPPHSPSGRLAIDGIPELRTSGPTSTTANITTTRDTNGANGQNGSLSSSGGVSAPTTPFKPVTTKKESRSIVTRFKGLFSRKGPEPRQVRFSINENNTSHESPDVILAKVVEALKSLDLPHNHFVSPFCIKTETDTGVVLEVEICQLPIIHLIGVRFRRICGDAWQYTRVCKRVLDLLDLNNSSKSNSSPSTGMAKPEASSSSSNPQGSSHPQLQSASSHTPSSNSSASLTPSSVSPAGNGLSTSPSSSSSIANSSANASTASMASHGGSSLYSTGDPAVLIAPPGKKSKRNSGKKQKNSHATEDGGIVLSTSSVKKLMVDERGPGKEAESPRHKKSPKGPSLPSAQWEDDSSSSETALVS